MMRSVRLDETLESRLEEVARLSGKPVSAIIRQAIEEHCEHILQQRLDTRLSDVVGVVNSTGGRARRSGKAFAESLQARRRDRG